MNIRMYRGMLLFTLLATLGGILTLIPWASASYPNIMGYRSLCTFAPAATLFCFFLAGLSCLLRASLVKESSGTVGERIKKHFHALIPVTLILAAALLVTAFFIQEKMEYRDDQTAVSEEVQH